MHTNTHTRVCVCKHHLVLDNPQGLIYHKIQRNQTKHYTHYFYS